MSALDWMGLVAGLVFLWLFCRWALHVMNTPRTTPRVPRDRRQAGWTVWGVGFGPFWFWF